MLELRRLLPALEPRVHEGVTVYGPISGDGLAAGRLDHWNDGVRAQPESYPVLAQLMLAARIAVGRWYDDHDRAEAEHALVEDTVARENPGIPTVRAILGSLDRPRHLFSPNFLADAPYNYYLVMLRNADLHYIFLEDTNSGYDMLGFIDGAAALPAAVMGAVELLKRWFAEENTIGVPERIEFGLLDAPQVEAILRASPYFEESRADLTDEEWHDIIGGNR